MKKIVKKSRKLRLNLVKLGWSFFAPWLDKLAKPSRQAQAVRKAKKKKRPLKARQAIRQSLGFFEFLSFSFFSPQLLAKVPAIFFVKVEKVKQSKLVLHSLGRPRVRCVVRPLDPFREYILPLCRQ